VTHVLLGMDGPAVVRHEVDREGRRRAVTTVVVRPVGVPTTVQHDGRDDGQGVGIHGNRPSRASRPVDITSIRRSSLNATVILVIRLVMIYVTLAKFALSLCHGSYSR